MPLKVDAKDRRLLLAAGGVFVLLIAITVAFSGDDPNKAGVPSTYSAAAGGAKAAYLVLARAGYNVERWESTLDQLPRGAGRTLILAEPGEAPTHGEKERLKAFLTEGGRVIATGASAGTLLPENDSEREVEVFGAEKWKKASALSPSPITRAAPQIVLAPRAQWTSYAAAYPLYGDGERTLVVKYPYGRGEVLWWASATPLTNEGLKEPGNLEFLLACMGDAKDGGGKNGILWDEYIHGYRPTLASSIAHSPVKWLVLQLVLLGLAVLLTFSRRSGPIFKPASVVRLSPIEVVETLGGLYEHAGTASVAVDICYQRFRYWLTRRLGVASSISVNDLEVAVRDRWAFIDEHFVATLRRCEVAKNDPYLHGPSALQLVQELDEYAVRLKLFQGTRKEKA